MNHCLCLFSLGHWKSCIDLVRGAKHGLKQMQISLLTTKVADDAAGIAAVPGPSSDVLDLDGSNNESLIDDGVSIDIDDA